MLLRLKVEFDQIILDDAEDRRCPQLREIWDGHGVETRVVTTSHGLYVAAKQRRR
jgi:hypothetical protein